MPLRLLLIEDSQTDALLLVRELRKEGFDLDFIRVDTPQELEAALDRNSWDAVISDYNMPAFSGLDALCIIQARRLDLPFIIVTGTIGEEKAVAAMKAGAHDFVLKENLTRLAPALKRELREAKMRRERQQALDDLRRTHEELEFRVRKRTEELEQINTRLASEITERKRVETALRESEERYRAVVEDQTEVISRIKADGTFIFVNEVYCRFFGKTRNELLGNQWYPMAFADDLPIIQEKLRALSPTNPVIVVENRVYSGSGEVRWMQFVNRGFFDPAGQLLETLSVGRDISRLKEIEGALRINEERLRVALTAAKMGVWDWDMKSNSILWSPELYDIVGRKEFKGTFEAFTELLHPDEAAHVLAELETALVQKSFYTSEFRTIRPDGETRWLFNHGQTYYDSSGLPLKMIGTTQDITERKQAEADLHSCAVRLIEMEENLRKKLAAELHDEIGRDLTVLGMNLAIVNDSLKAEAPNKVRERIEDSGRLIEAISRTVRNMMAMLRPPVLDDYGLLAALRWHCGIFTERTGIAVTIHADDPVPRMMAEKEMAFFRITQEALMNAAKHAGTREITITIKIDIGLFRFTIIDDGKGFVCESSKHLHDGPGLGLKIMRERAESIGGQFFLSSAPGKGTEISVELPLEDE